MTTVTKVKDRIRVRLTEQIHWVGFPEEELNRINNLEIDVLSDAQAREFIGEQTYAASKRGFYVTSRKLLAKAFVRQGMSDSEAETLAMTCANSRLVIYLDQCEFVED